LARGNLSRIIPIALSPASIRNVMADLESAGLIYAPHTSAGRLPTESGLRFFVDALLEFGDLGADERAKIEADVRGSGSAKSTETILTEASSMLSGLTRSAGVVLTTKTATPLKHIEFVRIEKTRALAVLVSEDGTIENRVLDLPRACQHPHLLKHQIIFPIAFAVKQFPICAARLKPQNRKLRNNSIR